jgi:rhodanese-related sulfurtransferase
MNNIDTVTLAALERKVVIDVREAHEFVSGHAPGAINLPLSGLVDRLADVPRDEPVYIICELGGRSAQATDWLVGKGIDATNVLGGTSAWRSAGLPVAMGSN